MIMIDENTAREDLEMAILTEDGLYDMFNESKLLDGGYTKEEMFEIISNWIIEGDECAA